MLIAVSVLPIAFSAVDDLPADASPAAGPTRANSVSPGIMGTPMAQGFLADPEVRQQRQSMVASRRFADPREELCCV